MDVPSLSSKAFVGPKGTASLGKTVGIASQVLKSYPGVWPEFLSYHENS